MLPLRITFAFKGRSGIFSLESSLSIAERLNLYIAEFEGDEISLNPLLHRLSKKGISVYKRIIRVTNINLLKKIFDFKHLFTEIQFELPYFFTKNKLIDIFSKLEKSVQKNEIVISIYINKSNINILETFLELANKAKIKKIVIPNPDLIRHLKFVKNHYLTTQDLNQLGIIKKYMHNINFSIHDFFISKKLEMKDADLFKGCQAGKFLCYIINGRVYPCKTVPILCGDIKNEPFEKIWERVEKEINKISNGKLCLNCKNSKICYFGCPGTVFFINSGIKDPLCEEQKWEST